MELSHACNLHRIEIFQVPNLPGKEKSFHLTGLAPQHIEQSFPSCVRSDPMKKSLRFQSMTQRRCPQSGLFGQGTAFVRVTGTPPQHCRSTLARTDIRCFRGAFRATVFPHVSKVPETDYHLIPLPLSAKRCKPTSEPYLKPPPASV